jgi:hypothetical protein
MINLGTSVDSASIIIAHRPPNGLHQQGPAFHLFHLLLILFLHNFGPDPLDSSSQTLCETNFLSFKQHLLHRTRNQLYDHHGNTTSVNKTSMKFSIILLCIVLGLFAFVDATAVERRSELLKKVCCFDT